MDRARQQLSARAALIAVVVGACASVAGPSAAPALREQIWTEAAPTLAHDLTHGPDRKSTRLNSSHIQKSRMPSSA